MIAYFDNSATTKPCPEAVRAVTEALTETWGNPSSLHRLGIEAERRVRTARLQVAEALGADPERVFFTAGGTEADNWAVFSAARRLQKRGKHIVTTQIEHHAILNPMRELESMGFEVTYLAPDAEGRVTVDALRAALRKDTILVSIMTVNNEVGSVMPVASMAKLTHRLAPNALFHTDAVQAFLHLPLRVSTLEADLISVSSHKVHGPKGAGALYVRKGMSLPPYLYGGGQENGYRSGHRRLRRGLRRGVPARGLCQGGGAEAADPVRSRGDPRRHGDRRARGPAHRQLCRRRRPLPGAHQLPAGYGRLRFGWLGLRQGPPEPRSGGHGYGPGPDRLK